MYTSYFANVSQLDADSAPISISSRPPAGWLGLQYKKLAPKIGFFNDYKDGRINEAEYTRQYQAQVLDKLDARTVFNELMAMAGEDSTPVLLCFEKPGDFCHRRLVANWLESELGIKVPEFNHIAKPKSKGFNIK